MLLLIQDVQQQMRVAQLIKLIYMYKYVERPP